MSYQMIGWQLSNGERHLLKGDATHHPGLEGSLLKYDPATTPGGLPPEECCCVVDLPGCCCEQHPGPASLFATISATGICGCLAGTYELTKITFLECPPGSPVEGFTYRGTFTVCGVSTRIELSCEPPTLSIEDLSGGGRDTITFDGSIGATHLIDCDPIHITGEYDMSVQETADWCSGDGIDDVESLTLDITE